MTQRAAAGLKQDSAENKIVGTLKHQIICFNTFHFKFEAGLFVSQIVIKGGGNWDDIS